MPNATVQKGIFSLAGLLNWFTVNLSKLVIGTAPAGLSRPVREREADLLTVIRALNEAHSSVIEHLNECRLAVIRVSFECRLGVIAQAEELLRQNRVSQPQSRGFSAEGSRDEGMRNISDTHHLNVREPQPLKSYGYDADYQNVRAIKKECAGCLESAKNNLPLFGFTVYGNSAPAKSGAGIGVPDCLSAIHDAPSVFFCVVGIAQPFFSSTVIIRAAYQIMVGCSGAEKSAPVSDNAGYANPVQSITSEIGVSGDGIHTQLSEAAIWLLPPPKNRLLFGAFTLASNHAISLLPLALSPKPDLFCLIAHACLLLASAQGALMLNQFTVLGYGTNKRGLTVGINYKITSDSTAKATAHAMLQAQRNGLTRITITRVMGATA